MDIALMNVRITFQKNEVVTDKIGNHKNAWSDFYSCYGKITAAAAPCHFYSCYATVSGEGGSEKAVAGLVVEDSDISFTVRYCRALSDIDSTKCRVLFDGAVYNIVSIDHMNFKKKCLKFKCEKV